MLSMLGTYNMENQQENDDYDEMDMIMTHRTRIFEPYSLDPIIDTPRNRDVHFFSDDSNDSNFEEESYSEADSDVDEQVAHIQSDDRPDLQDWCSCQQCITMQTAMEDVCCHHYCQSKERMGIIERRRKPGRKDITSLEDPVQCITDHPGFYDICLSPWTLEYEAYQYVEQEGRVGDDQPVNILMRHLAYKRFVRWIFGLLGRNNRVIIPSCVVKMIRDTYASDVYVGFRFPVY